MMKSPIKPNVMAANARGEYGLSLQGIPRGWLKFVIMLSIIENKLKQHKIRLYRNLHVARKAMDLLGFTMAKQGGQKEV